jgi:hypothetical protein
LPQDVVQTNVLHAELQFAGRVRSLLGMLRARLIALPSLLLALVLAGCGAGAGAGAADPASAVPRGTAIYFQGTIRPEGGQRDDVLDAARKVLRTDDPERKLHALIDQGLKESKNRGVTYEKDFAPWLGQKAGVWVAGVNRAKPGYVVIVAAKDTDKAQDAIDKGAKADGGKVTQRSYSGVDYQVDRDGVAAGIVGDFLAVGTEPEFKRTVKAQDGASLAGDKRYQRAMGALDDKRIGQFYIDLKPFLEQALKSDPQAAGQLEQLRALFPIDKLEPLSGALLADGNRIAVDSITRGKGINSLKALGPLAGTGSTPLLRELPGDAWVAFGAPGVGASLKHVFDSVAGALGGTVAAQQLKGRYGIDLNRDVFSWIGDVAVYARNTTRADIDGALVIEATNPATMRTAFGKLVGLIQSEGGKKVTPIRVKGAAAAFKAGRTDLGKPVVLARSDDRVVAALGEAAAAEALAPAEKLGDTPRFAQAKAILGSDLQPSFLLSMPDLVSAIESMGSADADFRKAKPYLDAFSVIASGGSIKGDQARSKVAAGLK